MPNPRRKNFDLPTSGNEISETNPALCSKQTQCELAIVIAILFVVKTAFLVQSEGPFPIDSDGVSYYRMARTGEFTALHPLGYGRFLTACFALTGTESPNVIVLAQSALGLLSAVITFWIARKYLHLPRFVALIPSMLLCISPLNRMVERTVFSDTVTSFLFTVLLFALATLAHRNSLLLCLSAGVLAGILPLFRTVFLFAAPMTFAFSIFCMLLVHKVRVRIVTAGLLLCLIGWASVYLPYTFAYSAHMRGSWREPPFSPTMISGHMIWARVLPLAQETDLSVYKWGDELYRAIAPRRDTARTDLGWLEHLIPGPANPTQQFLDKYGIGGVGDHQAELVLRASARRVMQRHPVQTLSMAIQLTIRYFAYPTPGFMEGYGTPTTLHYLFTYLRPTIAIASLIAMARTILMHTRPATVSGLLAGSAVIYAMCASMGSIFNERYWHPIEMPAYLVLVYVTYTFYRFAADKISRGHTVSWPLL